MAECCLCGENNSDAHSPRTGKDVHQQCITYAYADLMNYGTPKWTEVCDEIVDIARDVLGV